jgi:hypothetical protein
MTNEIKLEGNNSQPPAGGEGNSSQQPNPATSDEQQKKIKELEEQIKERDAKNAELSTTLATIEARKKEIETQRLKETSDADLQEKIKRITGNLSIDPENAGAELANLLSEVKSKAAKEAVQEAMSVIQGQSAMEKIRSGIKSNNADLDDELIDDVMAKANMLASTGKYKTAEEAIDAATKYVRGKLDAYATKKNASPKLPDGARAEGGSGNNLPPPLPPPKEVSPLEEIEALNEAKKKKLHI